MGVGLLGGSLGMAAKAAWPKCEIVGYGHRRSTLDRAVKMGAIDRAEEDLGKAVAGCDLLVLCTPVGVFGQLIHQMKQALRRGVVVTDVGSTKRSVVRLAEAELARGVHFIGSHPMAGSEKRGVEYARADLFSGALCITTPTKRTDEKALAKVEGLWKAVGMRIARLSPEDHDRHLAAVSHLPHALAAALVTMQEDAALGLAGKGFLDTTRIAGGDGALWRDILLDNADNLRQSVSKLREKVTALEMMLYRKDGEALARWLDAAARRRGELLARKLREVNPD